MEELLKNLNQSNPTPISCIVADTMLGWLVPLAKKLCLLSISFWTQNMSVFSITYHSYLGDNFFKSAAANHWMNFSKE